MKLSPLSHLGSSGVVITASILMALPAPAQRVGGQWTLEAERYGKEDRGFYGAAVAGPRDLDLDGYDDLLVGAPREIRNQGMVYAYSGRTHGLLWTWTYLGVCRTGTSVDGAGDLNGDGRPDVVVGAPETQASLCSVITLLHDGTVWWAVQSGADLGIAVAGAGDVNLDGFDDVIAGESRGGPGIPVSAGWVFVYSGRDGALLYRFDGQFTGDRLGLAVGAGGDVNADGWPDLIAGAPFASRGGYLENGAAYVYSGRDGSRIYEFTGSGPVERFGHLVAGAGDLDGDGHDDLLVAAEWASHNGYQSGSVYAYSGRTGGLLYRLDGTQQGDWFGTGLTGLGDVDLDGIPDFAVTAGEDWSDIGRVEIRSGADGALLDGIPGSGPHFAFGWSLADAGDADRDGFPDLIVGAKGYDHPLGPYNAGAAYLYSFDPFLHADSTEISATSGVPVQVELAFPASEALQRYALLFSGAGTGPTTIGGIQVPLGAGPLLSAMLGGQAPPNVQNAYGTLDGNARASAGITTHPLLAAQIGRSFHMAALSYDAATLTGRRSSIAWPITVVP